MTSPDSMAFALATSGVALLAPRLQQTLGQVLHDKPASPINQVLSAYVEVISGSPPGEHVVLVIDGCNTLTEWREKDASSLRWLLRFLVQVSRVQQQAHVVLATSDSAFVDWIKSGGQPT